MAILTLNKTKLYKELLSRCKKNDELACFLTGLLSPVEGHAQKFLQYIKHLYPSYTDHSIQHSIRIVSRISLVLKKSTRKNMSSIEIFVLIISAFFHDFGMVESARNDHHVKSGDYIVRYFNTYLHIIEEGDRVCDLIAFVCESHGLSIEELQRREKFRSKETIYEEQIRVNLLCILLRVGDLLDLDVTRACNLTLEFAPSLFNDESLTHHRRHKRVISFAVSSDLINIVVESKTVEEHQIWEQWLRYLKDDIYFANTCIFPDLNLSTLPPPNCTINKCSDADYELWQLRIELDDAGSLWKIISKSIYTTKLAFVRELISNAIDATLLMRYNDLEYQLDHLSPRSWYSKEVIPEVYVLYDETDFVVADFGIGMDKDALEKFLFKVASSGSKATKRVREFEFQSIAEFGIGFISTLSRSDNINITTKRVGDEEYGYSVELRKASRNAYVKKKICTQAGTTIRIKMDFEVEVSEVTNYVQNTFRYPCVIIKCIDLSVMNAILETCRSWKLDTDSLRILSALCKEKDIRNFRIVELEDALGRLRDLLGGAKKEQENRIREITNAIEQTRNEELELSRGDFDKYQENDRELESEIKDLMSRRDKSEKKRKQLEDSIRRLEKSINYLGADSIDPDIGEEPIAIKVRTDFSQKWVVYNKVRPKQISKGAHFIWIPMKIIDYDIGIEWYSMHGFIVYYGSVVDKLVLFGENSISKLKICTEVEYEEFLLEKEERLRESGNPDDIFDDEDDAYLKYWESSWFAKKIFVDRTAFVVKIIELSDYEPNTMFDTEEISPYFTESEHPNELRWYNSLQNSIYQDGIPLPISAAKDIAPIGVCRAIANLTGDARYKLNVTREDIDRSPHILGNWNERIGHYIRQRIYDKVEQTFKHLKIEKGDAITPAPPHR